MVAEAQMTDVDVDVDTSRAVTRDTQRSVISSSTTSRGRMPSPGHKPDTIQVHLKRQMPC